MYFEQFYLTCLSQASYMLASEGVAAVVDPRRDIGIYLEEAAQHGFEIRYVIETHLHADFVSGHRELAAATGARIYLGAQAHAQFPHTAVKEGDELAFGRCHLRFLETPGHTVESLSVVVTDLDNPAHPFAVLTGDTLFIGDVGRPDLSPGLSPRQLASMLYDSLHSKILKLPDEVGVYPAHGAGSLCGRNMSSERSSTIGREKATNYALRAKNRDEFVELLTADLPERPGYFAQDVEINRAGALPLTDLPELPALAARDFAALAREGATVLDTRPAADYCAAHLPGAVQIGLAGQFASWAGIVLGLDAKLLIVAEDGERAREARMRLARVGIERVAGYLEGGMAAWIAAGLPARELPQITAQQLCELLAGDGDSMQPGSLQTLDVRRAGEWADGHVERAAHYPLDQLARRPPPGLDSSRPVAVYCKSGYRSAIACGLLERAGFSQVLNVIGGFDAWKMCDLPHTAEGCAAPA